MNPVVQIDRTGCGIASVAAITGLSYREVRETAKSLGIFPHDRALWTETSHVRALLNRFGAKAPLGETPFSSWERLPDLALLAIKWHLEKGVPSWHWVVFARDSGRAVVLDPKRGLRSNVRTDFGRMRPKWYIPVISGHSPGREKSSVRPDFPLAEKENLPDGPLKDLPGPTALSGEEAEDLKKLEESLWLPDTRFSQERMENILAEGFFEFGSSGRIYDRQVTIRTPPREIGAKLPLPNFSARLLLSSVALVTYQSILRDPDGTVRHTLRSSVWTRTDRGWRLVFHQGTPIQSS
ncbi:MAG: DUF4440 domain-containing protein [Nitrospiraceae bacterium]|nr:DUF4440 domain-containing protein [Nitrospiraceae bacterium]